MKVVVSHPTGNQFVRALISVLSKEGLLSEFHTTLAVHPDELWLKLLSDKIRNTLLRRSYPIPQNQIVSHPLRELTRMLFPMVGLQRYNKHETGWASVDGVYQDLHRKVAVRLSNMRDKPDAIYAYEDGARSSFTTAKQRHIKCFYDLPIGYWRAAQVLLKAEQERWPDWEATLPGLRDSDVKLKRKDEELALADKIFVASKFTAQTLAYFPGNLAPVEIVPYGFPAVNGIRNYTAISATKPLKLLFVGGLSQRKGIADLFAAVKTFGNHIELTVIGNKVGVDCPALNEALAKHRWIPSLPHEGILQQMREHDVLVLPSLFEGFGLVITEAMAQGTPVITTDRTAGPDIIKDKENGWLIEAGSTDKLREAIEGLLLAPGSIETVGKLAMETARQRPWEVYSQEMLSAIVNNN